jgi:hypothetical protein
MTTFSRVTCLVGLATALVISTSGCDPYTYYNVDVTLQQDGDNAVSDPNTVMQFAGCDVSVYANDELIETGITLVQRTAGGHEGVCRGTETPRPNLGILDYSTARSSGTLKFKVNIYDQATAGPDQHIIVQGFTAAVPVSPGHVLNTIPLVASPCLDPNNPRGSKTNQPNEGDCS